MKMKLTNVCLAAAWLIAATGLGACNKEVDDNYEYRESVAVEPAKVFAGGMPKNVADRPVQTDEKGRVTSIKAGTRSITFEYLEPATRALPRPHVVMKVENAEERTTYNLYLNEAGFVARCEKIEVDRYDRDDLDRDVFHLTYDANGHLVRTVFKHDSETWEWKYVDGNMVEAVQTDREDGDRDVYRLYYTSNTVPTPIENKGRLMFYDSVIPADFDEFGYAYYAGLLGTATRHLPVSSLDEDYRWKTFVWTLNAEGYPTGLTFKHEYNYYDSGAFGIAW